MRRLPRPRALPSTIAMVAAASLAAVLPAEMLKARGDGIELRLVGAAGEHRLVLRDGSSTKLPLSAVASVGDFRIAGGDWLVAAVDRQHQGSALVVLEGRGAEIAALPSPAIEAEVREPRLLVAGEQLGGLVWLEGEAGDRMAVRASRWDGGEWEPAITVSPAGPGTQIALTATVLADGSWLAAWAAFDGEDDEILWSRRIPGEAGGEWTPPQPVAVDNAVPDITPAVIATADGALLAWSRYDGHDYRVQLARFDGGGWSEPRTIGGKGSAFPAFFEGRPPVLVYRQAVPDTWRVAEIDPRGKVLRQAEAPAFDEQTPVVDEVTADGAVLDWGEKAASVSWLQ